MATSEIDKLERRYAENPHGLTFAPLAEVHRKNGDLTRALELLRVGLELHPNYIPASIVLGRCHQDLGDLDAAEAAFAHVLRLDDENVIALKSMADINERQERLEEAEHWLRRLVAVDRSNDEARQQLQDIENARQQTSASAQASAVASVEAKVPPKGAPAVVSVEPTPPPSILAEVRSEPAEIAALDLAKGLRKELADPVLEPAALSDAPRGGASTDAPPDSLVRERPDTPSAANESTQLPGLESAEFEPPKESPGSLGLEIETESDMVLNSSGASEFTVPDASQDFAALAAKLNASRPRTPGRRASDRAAVEAREAPAQAKPVPPAEPLKPGPEPEPAAPVRKYMARETNGQSVAAFFQTLLAARPPEDAGASASPHASGSRIEDSSPPPAAANQGGDGLVSFDDFFSAATGGSSRTAGGEPGKDDLDQFQSWLQNLKR